MRVRKFREEDAPKVSSIIRQNFLDVNSREYSKETINALIRDSSPSSLIKKAKTRHYYVAVEKDEILGIGGYEGDELHTFFVKPKLHGMGVGKKLMDRVLKDAKKEGVKVMNCASTHYAERFYASCGFTRVEEKRSLFHDTELSFVLMKKIL